jgi:hypothetical protein
VETLPGPRSVSTAWNVALRIGRVPSSTPGGVHPLESLGHSSVRSFLDSTNGLIGGYSEHGVDVVYDCHHTVEKPGGSAAELSQYGSC